jgi:hypothetical protein
MVVVHQLLMAADRMAAAVMAVAHQRPATVADPVVAAQAAAVAVADRLAAALVDRAAAVTAVAHPQRATAADRLAPVPVAQAAVAMAVAHQLLVVADRQAAARLVAVPVD